MPDPDTMSMVSEGFGMAESIIGAFALLIGGWITLLVKNERDSRVKDIKAVNARIDGLQKEIKEFRDAIKRELDDIKATSEKDDDKVTFTVTKEMDRRIVNIEQLHAKLEASMEKLSKALERVAYLEGVHAEHKKI